MSVYAVTCVRLVCDVFRSVELVGAYPSAVTAALAMALHSVEAGVCVPDEIDSDHADASTTCRTPAGGPWGPACVPPGRRPGR